MGGRTTPPPRGRPFAGRQTNVRTTGRQDVRTSGRRRTTNLMDEQPSNQALPTEGWEFSKGVGALSLIESTFDCCSPGGTRADPAFRPV